MIVQLYDKSFSEIASKKQPQALEGVPKDLALKLVVVGGAFSGKKTVVKQI